MNVGNYTGFKLCEFCGQPATKFIGEDEKFLHICNWHFNEMKNVLRRFER